MALGAMLTPREHVGKQQARRPPEHGQSGCAAVAMAPGVNMAPGYFFLASAALSPATAACAAASRAIGTRKGEQLT